MNLQQSDKLYWYVVYLKKLWKMKTWRYKWTFSSHFSMKTKWHSVSTYRLTFLKVFNPTNFPSNGLSRSRVDIFTYNVSWSLEFECTYIDKVYKYIFRFNWDFKLSHRITFEHAIISNQNVVFIEKPQLVFSFILYIEVNW